MSAAKDRKGMYNTLDQGAKASVPESGAKMPVVSEDTSPLPHKFAPKEKGLIGRLKENLKDLVTSPEEKERKARAIQSTKPRHWV